MREFSEESRQHFDDLIDEVNDSDWCAFTDFLGDLQYNYGGVNMPYSLAEKAGVADDYWTDVIDAKEEYKIKVNVEDTVAPEVSEVETIRTNDLTNIEKNETIKVEDVTETTVTIDRYEKVSDNTTDWQNIVSQNVTCLRKL